MMDVNKRWAISLWSRLIGLIFWGIFVNLSVTFFKDTYLHVFIEVFLVILTFVFIIIIPDKIIFREYLVDRKTHPYFNQKNNTKPKQGESNG